MDLDTYDSDYEAEYNDASANSASGSEGYDELGDHDFGEVATSTTKVGCRRSHDCCISSNACAA